MLTVVYYPNENSNFFFFFVCIFLARTDLSQITTSKVVFCCRSNKGLFCHSKGMIKWVHCLKNEIWHDLREFGMENCP